MASKAWGQCALVLCNVYARAPAPGPQCAQLLILVTSGESRSRSLLQGQVDCLRSVCAKDSVKTATLSSAWPCQRGQRSNSGQVLTAGFPRGAQAGRAPERNLRSARHRSKTSPSLTAATG
jgi:hypothetical protein